MIPSIRMRARFLRRPVAALRTLARASACALLLSCGGDGGAPASAPRLLAAGASASAARVAAASALQTVAPASVIYRPVLERVYLAYFGRPADPAGLDYYAALLLQAGAPTDVGALALAYTNNGVVKSIIDGFGTSAESQALYPADNGLFIDAVYQNLFNRAPDAAGKAYWAGLLDAGAITRGSAAVAIMGGALNSDIAIVANKAQVASNFTLALNTSLRTASYDGLAANAVVRSMLGQVALSTDTNAFQASVESAIATLAGMLAKPGIYLAAGSPGGWGNLDGIGGAARFNFGVVYASGVASDAAGNLYVADTLNAIIRKITPAGVVSTFAGAAGQTGSVDGPAAQARFDTPQGLAIDAAGNLYVASLTTIRKITPAGLVSTFAGLSGSGGNVDGTGSQARFSYATGLCIDAAGNLYVADQSANTVRKITPQAQVTTLAGSAGQGLASTDGVGAAARFWRPMGVAVDTDGVLYVADTGNRIIRRIGSDGAVTTLAGTAGVKGAADGVGAQAQFTAPRALAASGGTVYVSDASTFTVRKISGARSATPTVSTLAGLASQVGDVDGDGAAARFAYPHGMGFDRTGALIVNTTAAVRRVTVGGAVSTVAGCGWDVGTSDGAAAAARFGLLFFGGALFPDRDGNILVADDINGTIRRLTPSGLVSTVAGVAGERSSTDGPAAVARFKGVRGLARDAAGALYVSGDAAIRKLAADGSVSTVAGVAGSTGQADGSAGAARFGQPNGLAFDPAGNLYILDVQAGISMLRKMTPAGVVSTVARLGGYAEAIVSDAAGNIYAAITDDSVIVKVDPGGIVTTLTGQLGQAGNADGPAGQARLNMPGGLAYDPAGKLYVTDAGGALLREVRLDGSVRTVAGTPGVVGLTGASALPGSLPLSVTVAYLAPKVLLITAECGVIKLILP